MPVPTDITAGTLTITNGSTAVTGTGTSWLASDLRQGDIILWIEGGDGFQTPILADVPASNTALTLAEPWEGPTLSGVRYRIRYQWDSSRVSAQSRQLIEMLDNGNVLALSGLTGPGVPVFDGPHSMVIRPETDFINGVAYDVQVDTLPDRAAYDGQAEGFAVLVSDVGDGRSALYSKVSNAVGDWSDPAYITGRVGPTPDIEATVANTAPGTAPTVTPVPITGGTRLDFTLPEASGFYNAGVYDNGATYTQDQVVRHNGSSFIALQAVPVGESPSSVYPPVDTPYWQVLVTAGQDGTGTGDVVGPASAVDGDSVTFDGLTGKLVRSGGSSDPSLSVSPIPIDMHFGTLAGIGWQSSEPGMVVSTTSTSAASSNTITVASATSFFVGQLICYVATDGQYYSVVIKAISGTTFTLDRILPAPIANGAGVYNFYRDEAHPNVHGYACLVDDAIRQAKTVREIVHIEADPAQWVAFGSATLTNETTSSYAFPGSTIASEQAVRVTSSAIGAGVTSKPVKLDGGTYATQVVINPGNRTGGFSGVVEVSVIAAYADGSTKTIASSSSSVFGDTVRSAMLNYRLPKGASVSIRVTSPNSGPWTFWVGMIRHSRVIARLRDLNHGRHVVFGDSWAAGGDFVNRLTARLPRSTVVNKGVSGDTSANSLSRFDTDMAGTNPSYVWVLLGTNDVYAEVTPAAFQANIDAIIAKIQAMGATPIVFNASVCSLVFAPAPGPRLDLSRQYAIRSVFPDVVEGIKIERGSNANGEYVRYPDGTQICWRNGINISGWVITTAWNGGFIPASNVNLTLPIAFSSAPTVTFNPGGNGLISIIGSATTTSIIMSGFSLVSRTDNFSNIGFIATGRWY